MTKVAEGKYQYVHHVKTDDEAGIWLVRGISIDDNALNSKDIYNEKINMYAADKTDMSQAEFNKYDTISSVENPIIERPTTERPTTEHPTTERPTTERPTTERPTTERPTTERPTTERPTTERPTTERPTTESPKSIDQDKPVVKYTGRSGMQIGSYHSYAFGLDVTDKGDSGIASVIGYLTSSETTNTKTVIFAHVSGSNYEGKIDYNSSYDYDLEYVIAKDNAGNTTKYYVNSVSIPSVTVPTTERPTTERPTTERPTTERPTTELPTTESTTTEQPTTEKPQVIKVDKPIISNKYIGDSSTVITGKGKSYSYIYAVANKKVIGKAKVVKGKFSMKIAKQKSGTKVTLYANYKNTLSDNVLFTVVDKTAPSYPTINKVTYKSKLLTGKGEKSAKVYVYNGKKKLGFATVDSKGNYKVKITPQKKYSILTVYLVDKAGNKGKSKTIKVS